MCACQGNLHGPSSHTDAEGRVEWRGSGLSLPYRGARMQIYVGNLPSELTDTELRTMFEAFGKVRAASIGREKKTGASEGYGFVEMPVKSEARAAIDGLRGKEVQGKTLRVKALKPGDEFHQHAQNLQRPAKPGGPAFGGTKQFRGTGAIRRGGQRGG
jgi:RNA recognition motif-containing protein